MRNSRKILTITLFAIILSGVALLIPTGKAYAEWFDYDPEYFQYTDSSKNSITVSRYCLDMSGYDCDDNLKGGTFTYAHNSVMGRNYEDPAKYPSGTDAYYTYYLVANDKDQVIGFTTQYFKKKAGGDSLDDEFDLDIPHPNITAATSPSPPSSVKANTSFNTVFGGTCATYECWIEKVWTWSMAVIVPLSVLILTAAGILYMTSEGDSGRIGIAKKMIIGVLSGVGLLILGRLLLIVVLGDAATGGWIF